MARRRYRAARVGIPLPSEPVPQQKDGDREGELQVRLTAQSILTARLRDDRPADQRSTLPAAPTFWEGMGLNLSGATLIDFSMTNGHVTEAIFNKATFSGSAWLAEATFTENAWFNKATFESAWFTGATFHKTAQLGAAVVVDPAANHAWPDGWRLIAPNRMISVVV
ncbi:pentapeptide repeat-containing protein [Streptosporangium pseudovulgare]|uniref:pentapeptide repeat-containing protein n=1 Tax=Streptosporangium pseudovulgare TaxID=35765 RepID=UPI0016717F06|nr:pentapeptide repeat-containing protein [Streptosporangium pseudovulgare]